MESARGSMLPSNKRTWMIRLHWTLVAVCALLILVVPTVYRFAWQSKYRWIIAGGWLLMLIVLAVMSKYVRRAIVIAARPRDLLGKAEAISQTPSLTGTLMAGFGAFIVGAFILVVLAGAVWSIVQAIFYKKPEKRPPPAASVLYLPADSPLLSHDNLRLPPAG